MLRRATGAGVGAGSVTPGMSGRDLQHAILPFRLCLSHLPVFLLLIAEILSVLLATVPKYHYCCHITPVPF